MSSVSLHLTAQTLDGARESIAAAQSASPSPVAPVTTSGTASPEVILDLSEAAQQLMTLPDAPAA